MDCPIIEEQRCKQCPYLVGQRKIPCRKYPETGVREYGDNSAPSQPDVSFIGAKFSNNMGGVWWWEG